MNQIETNDDYRVPKQCEICEAPITHNIVLQCASTRGFLKAIDQ
jgi:hypothetical protein